ncbi:MAG: hypothetical protein ACRBB3_09250 [Alphaproteobacteria bacterium]
MRRLLLVLLCLTLAGCFLINPDREFFNSIKNKIKDGHSEFPIKSISSFDWDMVCLLYDYYVDPPFDLLEKNGIHDISSEYHRKRISLISDNSDVALFVFSNNGATTQVFYYPSEEINVKGNSYQFNYEENDLCISSENAVFKIENKPIYEYQNGKKVALKNMSKKHKYLTMKSGSE